MSQQRESPYGIGMILACALGRQSKPLTSNEDHSPVTTRSRSQAPVAEAP